MADTDIIVSEMTQASQINTGDLMIMTQPDAQAETGYTTKSGTVLQVANKMLKGTEYSTDLPDFTDKTPLGGLEELKGDIQSLLPVGTASGNPCNFNTDIATNLVSVKCSIVASGGGGTPSTPIPIVGHSELNLLRCGKNLLNPSDFVRGLLNYEDGSLNSGILSWITSAFINASGTVTIQGYKDGAEDNFCVRFCEYDANKAFIKSTNNINISSNASFSRTITLDANTRFIRTTVGFDNKTTTIEDYFATNRIMLVIGNSTAYAPYNGDTFTVQFGQTVYGGELDVTRGKLSVTWGIVDLGSLTYTKTTAGGYALFWTNITDKAQNTNSLCESYINSNNGRDSLLDNEYGTYNLASLKNTIAIRDDAKASLSEADFKTAMDGILFAYELATPIEIDVSELSVSAIVGTNNITSDVGGDVEVSYREGIQHYIDKKIAQTQALVL